MEHRLRSPSRTYSNMPETRRAHGSNRNPTQPIRSRVEVEPSVYAEARKNGIFLPSCEYLAELLLGPDSPEPVPEPEHASVEETPPPRPRTPTPTVNAAASGQSGNPTPGSSGGTTCRREGLRQRIPKVNTQNQTPVVRPSTSRATRRSKRRLSSSAKEDNPAETSGATTAAPNNSDGVEVIVVEDSDSDSQSSADSYRNRGFFKESRLPYSASEDEEILRFVLTGNNVEKTSSILLWKELEAIKGVPRRTYQSLKNRFLRNIKPYILTRFRHLLTPESLTMLKRKFPDLRIADQKKYAPVRPYEKRVVCVNPSTEGAQSSAAADAHSSANNVTTAADPDERERDKDHEDRERPSTSSAPVNPPEEGPNNTAGGNEDGDAMGDNDESTDSRANDETHETNTVWPEPGLTHQLQRVVNIFAKEKLVNVPVQSFKFYDTIGTFANKAAVNLKLILDRSGIGGLPADVPINLNVTVTVGKEEENKPEPKRRSPSGRDRDNLRSRKDRMRRRRDAKRGSKKGLQRGYILKIKEKYMKKPTNRSGWYVKATNSMLYKAELEKLMADMKSNAIDLSSASHSDAEQGTDENVPENHSQLTNCSTEDESCYTQTLKKVSHIYKLEVKPTQSLIEDDSEDFSVGTAPTPPDADKETIVADAVLMSKGLTPPGCSLFQSGNV